MTKQIHILVADDNPIVRNGLIAMLGTQPDFEIMGEAADGAEVLHQAITIKPNIVLFDLEMPGMDGVVALQRLKDDCPEQSKLNLTISLSLLQNVKRECFPY